MLAPIAYRMTWTSPTTGTGSIVLNLQNVGNEGFEAAWTVPEIHELVQRWEYTNGWPAVAAPIYDQETFIAVLGQSV